MSLWLSREIWPADRVNQIFLLRAVDKVGMTLFGDRWCPPPQPAEENVTAWQADVFKSFDKDWQESFCHVRDLIAQACEVKELQSVYLNGTEVVAMGTREWLGDVNIYFKQGHIFLPNGTFPIFLREPSLDRFIAGLTPADSAQRTEIAPSENSAPKTAS